MTEDILTRNFFQLFDIPVSYKVDIDQLQKRYRDLQKTVHPDRFASASAQEKRISMQQTSWINEAFNTLKKPVDRAIYLLSLKGIDVNLEKETTMDAVFLMEQLEMRESLSKVRSNDDPLSALDHLTRALKDRTKTMSEEFANAYDNDNLDEARELIRKMQFIQKASREVDELSASIEDELY